MDELDRGLAVVEDGVAELDRGGYEFPHGGDARAAGDDLGATDDFADLARQVDAAGGDFFVDLLDDYVIVDRFHDSFLLWGRN